MLPRTFPRTLPTGLFVSRSLAQKGARLNAAALLQLRSLHLHEYQSKQLMDKYNVDTQRFKVVTSPDQVLKATKELLDQNAQEFVIKAQVHAGGRGKGTLSSGLKGGVQLTTDQEKAKDFVSKMVGYRLVTHQTPPEGVPVQKVMIAEALDIARETYFAILMDRASGGPVMVASPEGGVDIETVAAKTPEKIFKEPIDISKGVQPEQTENLARKLGFTGEKVKKASEQMQNLYKLFIDLDAIQVEINPFGETPSGRVVCFDAKIGFDDNAIFRHQDLLSEHDTSEDDPREVEAEKHGLNYVGMTGNIGCLVNGAGLAMATMDIIKNYGGSPANFLDVGGSATAGQVKEAFKILSSDKQVKAVLVNIFGGIMKCDTIAEGIVQAARDINLNMPLVVRLSGTNVDLGKKILADSKLPIIAADDLDDAAQKCASAVGLA
ncbi:Suclg2 protein, partial [Basidiobolus meristosporus CBS 931.73]